MLENGNRELGELHSDVSNVKDVLIRLETKIDTFVPQIAKHESRIDQHGREIERLWDFKDDVQKWKDGLPKKFSTYMSIAAVGIGACFWLFSRVH